MIAKAMHVKDSVVGQRMQRLVAKGQAQRLGRGFYAAMTAGPSSVKNLEDLLEHLKKEREQLDAKIVRVQEALEIHREWVRGK